MQIVPRVVSFETKNDGRKDCDQLFGLQHKGLNPSRQVPLEWPVRSNGVQPPLIASSWRAISSSSGVMPSGKACSAGAFWGAAVVIEEA